MGKITSPPMFYSDDDEEPQNNSYIAETSSHSNGINEGTYEKQPLSRDEVLFKKASHLMDGIPPPSNLATCYLTCEEMLAKYNENKSKILPSKSDHTYCPKDFFLSLNNGDVSERLAVLMQRIEKRFIQKETLSTCNIWFKDHIPLTKSAKKLKKDISSPGRRLSHLARRRQFFSKDNLQQLGQSGKPLIEINKRVEHKVLPRRALFQSPEHPDQWNLPGYRTVARPFMRVCSRRLFGSGEKRRRPPKEEDGQEKARKRRGEEEEREGDGPSRKRMCSRRSLNFEEEQKSREINSDGISELHKKKLLWAVATALNEQKITRKDLKFRSYASQLFGLCKNQLNEILSSLTTDTSTSEKMLIFARQHVPLIVQVSHSELQNKENELMKTPIKKIRPIQPRLWKTCLKEKPNCRLLLVRSKSVDSLLENDFLQRESLERCLVQGSQETIQDRLFPALSEPSPSSIHQTSLQLVNSSPKSDGGKEELTKEYEGSFLHSKFFDNGVENSPKSDEIPYQSNVINLLENDSSVNGSLIDNFLTLFDQSPTNIDVNLTINHETPLVTLNITEKDSTVDFSSLNNLTSHYHPPNIPSSGKATTSDNNNEPKTPSTPIIMKKNRQNWKVMQSAAAEGTELKLKMRLYQEWEVVNKDDFEEFKSLSSEDESKEIFA